MGQPRCWGDLALGGLSAQPRQPRLPSQRSLKGQGATAGLAPGTVTPGRKTVRRAKGADETGPGVAGETTSRQGTVCARSRTMPTAPGEGADTRPDPLLCLHQAVHPRQVPEASCQLWAAHDAWETPQRGGVQGITPPARRRSAHTCVSVCVCADMCVPAGGWVSVGVGVCVCLCLGTWVSVCLCACEWR